jgi:hypothetical protein
MCQFYCAVLDINILYSNFKNKKYNVLKVSDNWTGPMTLRGRVNLQKLILIGEWDLKTYGRAGQSIFLTKFNIFGFYQHFILKGIIHNT